MSFLSDKAKRLADLTKKLVAEVGEELDEGLAKVEEVTTRKDAAVSKLSTLHQDVAAGVAEVEEVVKNLTNG